jgi:hypothetical protein
MRALERDHARRLAVANTIEMSRFGHHAEMIFRPLAAVGGRVVRWQLSDGLGPDRRLAAAIMWLWLPPAST